MDILIQLNQEDAELIKNYAELNNISVTDLFKQSVIERIETDYDLEMFKKAKEAFQNDPFEISAIHKK